jgi:hypothetical protein
MILCAQPFPLALEMLYGQAGLFQERGRGRQGYIDMYVGIYVWYVASPLDIYSKAPGRR